jgi:hypothetical protein
MPFIEGCEKMPLHQVSVLTENKPGSMARVLSSLENKFRIFALSIAEAGEFGIVRLIVSEPKKASEHLETSGFNLAKSRKNVEVIGVPVTDRVRPSEIAGVLGDNGVNIDYAYSSSLPINGQFALILRIDDVEKAEKILAENGIQVLNQENL